MCNSIEQGQRFCSLYPKPWGGQYLYKGRLSRYIRSESDALYDAVNKSLQSFDLVFRLGCIVFDRDRFRQRGQGCSAVT